MVHARVSTATNDLPTFLDANYRNATRRRRLANLFSTRPRFRLVADYLHQCRREKHRSAMAFTARSLSASKQETLCKIVVPAIAGYVLTGLRVSMGIAWVILVPCEMLGVNEGLGYFILDTCDRLAYSELMAVVVIIGLIG